MVWGCEVVYLIDEIKSIVREIASDLPVSKVILVGSYARQSADESSDIDLVVDGQDLSETYWELLFRLEDALSAKIDLLTMRGFRDSIMRESILGEGVLLYET